MLETQERQGSIKKEQSPRPHFTFSGLIGKPGEFVSGHETLSATAIFNTGLTLIDHVLSNGKKERVPVGIARLMNTTHENGKADATKKFIVYAFEPGSDHMRNTQVIDPTVFLSDKEIDHTNVEDFRLTYLAKRNLVVACFTTVTDEKMPLVPRVTLAVAKPTFTEKGEVSLDFSHMHVLRDETGNTIQGKNCIVLDNGNTDELTVLYRPEFLPGTKDTVNGNYFQFAKVSIDENGHMNGNVATVLDGGMAIPFFDRVKRFGWNGGDSANGIPFGQGQYLDVIHYIERNPVSPDGKKLDDEYGFLLGLFERKEDGTIACKGVYSEPFFSYKDQQKLLQDSSQTAVKFNDLKNVIYCSGLIIDGNDMVLSVSIDDSSFGLLRVPIDDVITFASESPFLLANSLPLAIQRK